MHAFVSASSFAKELRRLIQCERGAVAPLFLVSAGVLIGTSLGGIDLARYASTKTRLQNALDAAVLASAREAMSGNKDLDTLTSTAQRYFEENFPEGYHGAKMGDSKWKVAYDGTTLTVQLDGELPLIVGGFLDITAPSLWVESKVNLGDTPKDLEVVFAVDTTASISSISADLLELTRELTDNGAYIGIVPYSSVVNVGTKHASLVKDWQLHTGHTSSPFISTSYHKDGWAGCIAEPKPWNPPNLYDINPLKPDSGFIPIFARVKTTLEENKALHKKDGYTFPHLRVIRNQNSPQPTNFAHVGAGPDRRLGVSFVAGNGNSPGSFTTYSMHEIANCEEWAKVEFLTDDTERLENKFLEISKFSNSGNEALPPAALLWSWRMLTTDPNWRGVWNPAPNMEPSQDPKRSIVLVTSGRITEWSQLSSPPLQNDPSNYFRFSMTYDVYCATSANQCGKYKSPGEYEHTDALGSPVTQKPVSSLAMANPFGDGNISFSNNSWGKVEKYTTETCKAIREDRTNQSGKIDIYVLSLAKAIPTREIFEKCADAIFYDVRNLQNKLLTERSSSPSKLRLTS